VCSSLALARRLRRRRELLAVVLDPSRTLLFDDGLVFRVRDRLGLLILKETFCDDVYGLDGLLAPRFIVDVGAGVGSFAVVAACRFPGCRVLAFEPDPLQHGLLRENAAANDADVESFCVAIGTKSTYLLSGEGAQTSTVVPSGSGSASVPGVRLGDFVRDDTVDLLKIDCEGAELDVLQSLSPAGLERVSRVVLEYHNLNGGRNDEILASLLRNAGYYVRLVPDPYTSDIGYLHAHRPSPRDAEC
jgi:FkbM family methyltransferase